MYDVAVIGAGVTGCSIARELSRYKLNICVFEKEEDVCAGTSKANSAIIHAGYGSTPGTLMAKLNVRGNQMMDQLADDLDFPFRRNGAFVLCFSREDRDALETLMEQGVINNVAGLRIIERDELHEIEPAVSSNAAAALYAPTSGIVCPFNMTIALAENAAANGVEFRFNTEVKDIEKSDGGYTLTTKETLVKSRIIINAAGVYGDTIHNLVSTKKLQIVARKGEYCLFDKTVGNLIDKTLFQLPGPMGKGVLVTPTVHGNLLIGPTAADIDDKSGTNTTKVALDELLAKGEMSLLRVPREKIITSFAGLRAHPARATKDFIIEELSAAPGFIDVIGIESPGLSSAPAIGEYVREIVYEKIKPEKKTDFISKRKGIINTEKLSLDERQAFIAANPAFGNIICRCEQISEGEILSAIHRSLGAKSLDGIKRRTRAGAGRCQAGFCSPRIMEILSRELGIDMSSITKSGGDSKLLVGKIKKDLQKELK